tara:strand:- start:61 stop:1323 length:1263 start_codon:yes stop_codon:yes gene_type:complete
MIQIIKIFIYLLIFIIPIVWFSNYPGEVRVIWKGYLIETSFFVLVLLFLVIIFLTSTYSKVFLRIKSFPRQFTLKQKEKKLKLTRVTLENLSLSWISNDFKALDIEARKLKKYSGDNTFTTLLLVQSAIQSKQFDKALKYLRILEKNIKTQYIAFKCKAMIFVNLNKKIEATEYLQKAFDINPRDKWVCENLSVLLAKSQKWEDAAKTLENLDSDLELSSKRAGYLFKSGADPVITYQIYSDCVPVVISVLKHYLVTKNDVKVFDILNKTWKKLRYLGLIDVIFDQSKYDIKLALKRFKYVNKALKNDLESDETKIAMSFAALQAKLWEKSRSYLVSIGKESIDSRVMRIWKELSEKSDRIKIPKISNKLAESPFWFCKSCNSKTENWAIHCNSCDSIGTIVWSKSIKIEKSRDLTNTLF